MIPVLARTRLGLTAARRGLAAPVILVPTMGALHEGHRALLHRARQLAQPNGNVVVSVFVNPLQFGPAEDLDRYPRTLDTDMQICAQEGVALVFAPGPGQMYPQQQMITVDPGPMGQVLEGASRPGFFTGVLTVVLKLFQLVKPDMAVFGEKDAQQLALVRRMVADFALPIEIVAVPTVREPDGLAVSSRNSYLSAAERRTALALSAALRAGAQVAGAGGGIGPDAGAAARLGAHAADGTEAVLKAARAVLDKAAKGDPPLITDYLALVDPATFAQVGPGYAGEAVLLAAAWAGSTRLIDNVPLTLQGAS